MEPWRGRAAPKFALRLHNAGVASRGRSWLGDLTLHLTAREDRFASASHGATAG
jgi:hypothetical protein